jgi:predicted nucleic acid-binding protein
MDRRIVCNTGPLIAFAMLDRMDILHSLFDDLFVPPEVHQEILAGGGTNAGLSSYLNVQWIRVEPLLDPPDPLLSTFLDKGEAAVIGLARRLSVNLVLIDERKARKIARTIYGLDVVGSVRLLIEAKKNGLLDRVGNALKMLREGGYWIADDIVEKALFQAGEK